MTTASEKRSARLQEHKYAKAIAEAAEKLSRPKLNYAELYMYRRELNIAVVRWLKGE